MRGGEDGAAPAGNGLPFSRGCGILPGEGGGSAPPDFYQRYKEKDYGVCGCGGAAVSGDQALKLWVAGNFALFETRPLLPGFLELKYVQNTGGGWSVLSEHTWLLSILTALIMAAVAVVLARRVVRHPLGVWACTLILTGGLGNLVDRLRLGYVVDMFNFQFIPFRCSTSRTCASWPG